jgi:SAM-dependent methyltransferase
MRLSLCDLLACPACGGSLEPRGVTRIEAEEILEAELACTACGAHCPVRGGIPRFVEPAELRPTLAHTAKSFGFEWRHFREGDDRYQEQFLGWIAPVRPSFFPGKLVLEAGCGKGRHTLLASDWGAEVVAVDVSDAVETAFAATRGRSKVHVIQADIHHLPLRPVFDYAFSVGVLHHLPDPRAGFAAVASKVRPGGALSTWVYGAENNGWITHFVTPMRERLTSRIDQRLLLQASKLPTALLFLATKLVYGPLNRSRLLAPAARGLFYNDYLRALAAFGWREHHSIVFDHLVPPIAHYVPREEFARWWRNIGVENAIIGWHNKNSWRGFGTIGAALAQRTPETTAAGSRRRYTGAPAATATRS